MRYCSAKLNVISDVLRDGGGWGKKNHHQMLIKHFRLTKLELSESRGVKLVYRQLKFEYVCQNRCQFMGKVHVIFDNPSYTVRKKEKRKKTIFMKTKVAHFCVNTDILSND